MQFLFLSFRRRDHFNFHSANFHECVLAFTRPRGNSSAYCRGQELVSSRQKNPFQFSSFSSQKRWLLRNLGILSLSIVQESILVCFLRYKRTRSFHISTIQYNYLCSPCVFAIPFTSRLLPRPLGHWISNYSLPACVFFSTRETKNFEYLVKSQGRS